jgi:hypothetical protein
MRDARVAGSGWRWALVGLLATGACDPEMSAVDPGPIGSIELALTAVPADARCLRITITGKTSVQRSFDLDPGPGSLLTVGGIGAGAVTIAQQAFGTPCRHVDEHTAATWISEPTAAVITAGRTTQVSMVLRPTGRVRLDENFDPGVLAVSPTSATFGPAPIGGTSPTLTFVVKNAGRITTGSLGIAVAGRDAADFVITSNPCTVLGPDQACAVGVALRPRTAGPKSASLLVSGVPGGDATASLAGDGLVPPALVISPLDHDFGIIDPGDSVGPFTFTVRNIGQAEALTPTVTLEATSLGGLGFAVDSNGCRIAALAPGATCLLGVVATASTVLGSGFEQTAKLRVTSADGVSTESSLSLTIR